MVDDAAPNALHALFLGSSKTNLPLGGGCSLLTSPVVSVPGLTDAGGSGAVPIPIPADPVFKGGQVLFQYFIADPAGAFAGLGTLSDGLHVLIGL